MIILVTGAKGMIGSHLVEALLNKGYEVVGVDRVKEERIHENYKYFQQDLSDIKQLKEIVEKNGVEKIIHLAALAHAADGKKYTWEHYYKSNVECAENVFRIASYRPVLYISTVDVYGFTRGIVDEKTVVNPVSNYGKSKVLAEKRCEKLCDAYTIFRFSPVYTKDIKRDIQKRYYLKYPNIAYKIGKGSTYEVLYIDEAVDAMVRWCSELPMNEVKVIKDLKPLNAEQCIQMEKKEGRAKLVLWFPRWIVVSGYLILKWFTGENKYTYLLSKAVYPLKTKDIW